MSNDTSQFKIGHRVQLTNSNRLGTVRYIGEVQGKDQGEWIGIEVDEPFEFNYNNGNLYFECKPHHAIFLRADQLQNTSGSSPNAAEDDKNISVKQITKSPIQMVFYVLGALSILPLFPWTKALYDECVLIKANLPKDYVFPNTEDLHISYVVAIVHTIIIALIRNYFYKFFLPICKEQSDLKLRDIKTKKSTCYIYKFTLFTIVQCWAYYNFAHLDWFPWQIGGTGESMVGLKGWPYRYHAPGVKIFLQYKIGYYIGEMLVLLLVEPKRGDYIEMFLHHLMTLFSHGGMYLMNQFEVTIIIDMYHDFNDITLGLTKCFTDTIYKSISAPIFAINLIVWAYVRLLLFPLVVYQTIISPYVSFDKNEFFIKYFFLYQQASLIILHFYWFHLQAGLLLKYVGDGSTEDSRFNNELSNKNKDKVKQQ